MRVRCDGAKCYVTEVETLASGAINYFTAKFTFDSAWADFITANQLYSVFEGSDMVVISNLAYNSETQTYDCEIPWQVITQEGELYVGAIGHITTPETVILTTNMAFAYRVPKGAATTGNEISDPSGLLLNILEASGVIQENVDKTNAAISHWPIIDPTTQNWFRWDTLTENYVDTGTSAVGEKGKDLVILGHYDTLSFLQSEVLSPVAGETYSVGTTTPYTAYIYDGVTSVWVSYGEIFGGSGGSSEGSVTQVDFDAHVDSLLMHKPAIECTVIGTASVEGYRNTAGYLGVYYYTPFGVLNTVVATESPNEFIITFADTRPFAIVNEPIKLALQSGWMSYDGIVVGLGVQTITVQLTGDISPEVSPEGPPEGPPEVSPEYMLEYIIFLTQPASSYVHAEGDNTVAQGSSSHAEGSYTFVTSGDLYKIMGVDDTTKTITLKDADGLVVGDLLQIKTLSPSRDMENPSLLTNIAITAINENEVTLDTIEPLIREYEWAIKQDYSYGSSAHVEGYGGMVTGWSAHGEGSRTLAGGDVSHAEGDSTVASGAYAHAEGDSTVASGYASHAQGSLTIASGAYAHAEGDSTVASGYASHAQGTGTEASGDYAHAEGDSTVASGYASHAQGTGTIADEDSQTVLGKYNAPDSNALLIIGNGTDNESRSNILTVGLDGWTRTSGAKTAVIPTQWIGELAPYTQEILIDGIDINDEPIIYPIYSEDNELALLEQASWNMISDIKTDENKIIIRCLSSLPDTAINIRLMGGSYSFSTVAGPSNPPPDPPPPKEK